MELVLAGNTSVTAESAITVSLPEYMRLLPDDHLKEARIAEQRAFMVLAAGRHPETGDLVAIFGDGKIMEVHLDEEGVPETSDIFPIDYGHTVKIVLKDTDKFDPIEVAPEWILHVGRLMVDIGSLPNRARVSYLDE